MLEYLGADREFQNGRSVDMVKSDVYSLGVCVMEIAVMKFCGLGVMDMEGLRPRYRYGVVGEFFGGLRKIYSKKLCRIVGDMIE